MSRDCDHSRCQTTIDRLALELAQERAEHRRTAEERDSWKRRAGRWRWVAQIIHQAHQEDESHGRDR